MKVMTLRLPTELASDLEVVAAVDELPVVEVVRLAVTAHIESRRHDESFQQALARRIEREQLLLHDPTSREDAQ